MTGVPGSGKTTLIKEFFKGATIVRPDDWIGYTTEDPWTPAKAKTAWKNADEKLNQAIKNKDKEIVFDATLTSVKARKRFHANKKQVQAVVSIFCNTSFDLAKQRNDEREKSRQVPKDTLIRMASQLETPTTEECFNEVIEYDGVNLESVKQQLEDIRKKYEC